MSPCDRGPFYGLAGAALTAALRVSSRCWAEGGTGGWLASVERVRFGCERARMVICCLATMVSWVVRDPGDAPGRTRGRITAARVAARIGVDPRSTRAMIARLRAAGWIWQDPDGRVWVGWG